MVPTCYWRRSGSPACAARQGFVFERVRRAVPDLAVLVFCDLAVVLFAPVARGLAERVSEAPVDFEADAVAGFDRLADDFERDVVFFAVTVTFPFFAVVVLLTVVLPVVDSARVDFVPLAVVGFREAVVDLDAFAVVDPAELLVRAFEVDFAAEVFAVAAFPLLPEAVRLVEVAAAIRDFPVPLVLVPVAGFAAVDFCEVVRDRLDLPVDLRVEVLAVLAIPWTP